MTVLKNIKNALLVALWFIFLTFPLLVIKVNAINDTVTWRWENMLYVGLTSFFLYLASKAFQSWKMSRLQASQEVLPWIPLVRHMKKALTRPLVYIPAGIALLLFFLIFPTLFSMYQVNIMLTALMYVILGLGLNIVVGLAGLLDLGYVAFYAVGAYAYALLHLNFGMGFWTVLPIAAALACFFGVLLGFPVLRLRGDYLAIVTLGFGEIIRLVLENWNEFSQGPSGISNIPRPTLFGLEFGIEGSLLFLYYLTIGMVLFTIFVVNRLQDSRIGRAWMALREDEIACQAMGIDKMKTKLTAFALGATWAGMVGVIFAAKTTFVNPASFTFLESAIILCIVVLGGMGSIVGVIIGALVLILLPEYLRDFADYRMLAFGATLVVIMVFKPKGLITGRRKQYKLTKTP